MVEYIADVGTAWCGDLDLLNYMVGKLKRGGATAFKPQVWPKSIYKGHRLKKEALKCHIDKRAIQKIDEIAANHDLEVFFSVFDAKALQLVRTHTGARRVKFSHSKRTDSTLIGAAILTEKFDQVIISVDNWTDYLENVYPDIRDAAYSLGLGGWPNYGSPKVQLLYCVPDYPTDLLDVKFPKDFECLHGFSDHTTGVLAPVVAVACGAKMIEKHVMCNEAEYLRYLGEVPRFPDEVCAASLDKFALMVGECKLTERMIQ